MADSEWLEWRSRGIGASDIAGILGISPWNSPYSVWQSKALGISDESGNAEAMRWGTLLEGAILAETSRRLDITIHSEQTRCEHKRYPWARATVDALFADDEGDNGVVEVKTTSEPKWSDVPQYYQAQVQWQLEVTDRERAWVACLHTGRRLSLWRMERDKTVGEQMLEIAHTFWFENVQPQIPPAIDGSNSTTDAISRRYAPPTEPEPISIDAIADYVTQLRQAREAIAKHGEVKDTLENEIKAAMGEHEAATIDGLVVATWKRTESRRLDTELLRDIYPEQADDCTVTIESRRFLLKKVAGQ